VLPEFLKTFLNVLRHVQNPLPLFLDRANLLKRTYVLNTRRGLRVEIRPGHGDRFAFYEIMVLNQYLRQGQFIRPGDIVIDIGANIGCFTLLASRAVGPTGRVIAVEPESSTFTSLQRNIELNRCENVVARRFAVGRSSGTVQLHVGQNALFNSIFNTVGGTPTGSVAQQVPLITLAELMDALKIAHCNYLKVDCEGAEYDIFSHMSRQTAQRIDQITMEVHNVPGYEPEVLRSHLTNLGFRHELQWLLYAWR
jgi:FkbM family methyltransferase